MFGTTRGKASAKMSAARAVVFLQAAAFLFYAADTLYMLPGPDPFAKYFGIGGLYGTYAPSRHLCDFSALNVVALALGAVLVGVSYSEAAVRRFCLVLMTHNLAVLGFLVGMGTNTNSGGAYEPSEFGAAFGVTAACAALGFWASRGPLPEPRLRVRSSLDALCLLWAAVDLGTVFKSMVLRGGPEDTWVVPGWFGGSIPRGDPQGHYLAVQYNACTLLGLALHSLFLLQFSEPKHAKGRALLALLVAQLYLRKLYQVWEAGDMQPSALWFYAGVQIATVALALPALLLKKPKSA